MSIDYQYKRCAVRVNEGSGCLVQPNTEEYTYVITVEHNLTEKNKVYDIPEVSTVEDQKITVLGVYPHPDLDLAILKVEFQKELKIYLKRSIVDYSNLTIYGFPTNKKQDEFVAKKVLVKLIEQPEPFFVLSSPSFADQNDVMGFSGCGVFEEINGEIYLVGIEFQMDSSQDEEARINMLPINLIDEIIQANIGELEKIVPKYMEDFGCLLEHSFTALDDQITMVTKEILKSVSQNQVVSSDLSPEHILKKYKQKISPNGEFLPQHHFSLWLGWLEFLTFCVIEKEEFDSHESLDTFLSKVMENKKFFFINNANWTTKIKKIYQSDLTGLDEEGVIVANSFPSVKGRKIIPKGSIPDIAQIPSSQVKIDSGVNSPYNFKLMHIAHLIDKILENEDLVNYGYDKEQEILETIKSILVKTYGN